MEASGCPSSEGQLLQRAIQPNRQPNHFEKAATILDAELRGWRLLFSDLAAINTGQTGFPWKKCTGIAGTISGLEYSEVLPLFTGAPEEPSNIPKLEGFGLTL
jgi:hypothetical protein